MSGHGPAEGEPTGHPATDPGGRESRGRPVRRLGPPPGRVEAPQRRPGEVEVVPGEYADPLTQERGVRWASLLFVVSTVATMGFIVAYVFMKIGKNYGADQNWVLGSTLALSLLTLGSGMIVWAKKVIPQEDAIGLRHDGPSPSDARTVTEDTFISGFTRLGVPKYRLLRRTVMAALGIFPLSLIVLLRDMGPAPGNQLETTTWRRGLRLVDLETKLPVRLGDIAIGGIKTVMPEGYDKLPASATALDPTILIRLRPEEIKSRQEADWSVAGHVAYSKICTHAGCPISLYEQQSNNLFCPCHQSTFKMTENARVIFGPAARPLPQLPLAVDGQGYLIAASGYHQPVGPSFWSRS